MTILRPFLCSEKPQELAGPLTVQSKRDENQRHRFKILNPV